MNIFRITLGSTFVLLAGISLFFSIGFSADLKRNQKEPILFLDEFANELNIEGEETQENSFNNFNPNQGQYASQYKISNTLDTIRIKIAPYIQRTMYIGLSLAVIAIIYNGLMLVLHPAGIEAGESSKIKKRLGNILIGVFILVGFYAIVEIMLLALTYLIQ